MSGSRTYAPALGHQAVIERLLDFTANWSKARATAAELAALARGCTAAYRDQEAALARCIAADAAPVIGPPVLARPPLLPDLGPVAGAGPSVLRLPEPPPSIRISYPWFPLAEENPVRGDPWAVLDLARYLGERAAVIADIARALERIQTGEVGGAAGDAFRERLPVGAAPPPPPPRRPPPGESTRVPSSSLWKATERPV